MIPVNKTNILLLTMPRTGTHFTQYFLFEGVGRIVPLSGQSWLDGKNPISFTPDHCIITEHFNPDNIALINQILTSGEDVRVVVPMQDLMRSFISAKTMNHRGFLPALDAFVQTIDSIPHHKFILDDNTSKAGKLNALLSYCGIDNHNSMGKYIAWDSVNSARPSDDITQAMNPQAYLAREIYDDANAEYTKGNIQRVRDYWPDVDELINKTGLKEKLSSFGYGSLSW